MKKLIAFMTAMLVAVFTVSASEKTDSTMVQQLNEVTVSSLYRSSTGANNTLKAADLQLQNHGQGPDYVLQTLPNIFAYNDNGTPMGYSYFRLRGMGQERINITFDGIPWNEAEDFGCYFSNSPDLMASMHSIQVENGSSVTNNGSAAYAGNVSLESVNLKTDTVSYAELGAGSFNTFRASAVYNMGIKNKWGFHIRGTQQQTDGYKENTFNNSQALAMKLGYFFNENHSVDLLTMNGFHRNGQGYMGLPMSELPKHSTPFKQVKSGNMQQETDNFFTTYNRLQYTGKFNGKVFLTSSFYWNHQTGDYRVGWYDESIPAGKVLNNYHLVYNMFGLNTVAKWFISNDLSLTGGINGYLYSRSHKGYDVPDPNNVINIWHTPDGLLPYYANSGDKPEFSSFATLKYSPVKDLHLTGSVQYRMTSLDYSVKTPAYGDTEFDKPFKHTWNFVNFSLAADYMFVDHNIVYAKYAEVSREPSRTDIFGGEYIMNDSPLDTQNERVHNLEIGYTYKNSRMSVTANGFYMNFHNELVATGDLSPVNFLPIHKQMDTYRTGLELTTAYNPFNSFNIILNGAYMKSELRDYKTEATFSPKWTLFGEVNYTFNKVKVGVNTNYRSKMYLDVENNFSLRPGFTLNAYVNAPIYKNIEVSAFLNNLTNRLNISNGSVSDNTAYYLIDSPFNFYLSCKFKF